MKDLVLVGLGGALGAMARFRLGALVLHHTSDVTWKFPLSTFVVNFTGCLAAGLLAGLAEKQDFFGPIARIFLFTGLLGGYTTFSAFGLETVYLLQRQDYGWAAANIAFSVGVGVLALWLGIALIPLPKP